MAECTPLVLYGLTGAMCLLAVGIVLCLVRAVRGPRYTDRLVAMNLICTLVDVAILYGLLNLLAVAVLSRVAVEYHRKKEEQDK